MKLSSLPSILSVSLMPLLTIQVLAEKNAAELYRQIIPEDKNLPADWLESLRTRGHELDTGIAASKKDKNLSFIGMPVGGVACGSLIIDGAGQLYAWDIFGNKSEGVIPKKIALPKGYPGFKHHKEMRTLDGANYMAPPSYKKSPPAVKQGFSVKVKGAAEYQLGMDDWEDIEFTGKWPMGIVDFQDSKSPLKVTLKAYSPFIPLDIENSKLPATVMSYTVTNTSNKELTVEFAGWLGIKDDGSQSYDLSDDSSVMLITYRKTTKATKGRGKGKVSTRENSVGLTFFGEAEAFKKGSVNGLRASAKLAAGESKTFNNCITWQSGHDAYSERFEDAKEVSSYVATNFKKLSSETQLWVDTWNDTTLPQWFIDRSMAPASTMQTSNLQFSGDRFWAWEGIGAGKGTCTHVWAYSQAMARLFPSLERNLREKTDFANVQLANGGVPFRPTKSKQVAIDGQCGTVLRSYREHLTSVDAEFLKRNWADIKNAMNYLIEFDKSDDAYDGLLDGEQHNTLDAEWYGKVHVLCSLYLAALRAGEEMAIEMDDADFKKLCRDTFNMGSKNIEKLYNGEYYVQLEDPKHADAIGVGKGVYIDQVYGQFWANQVGLGSLYNQDHIKSSLNAVWKYNFLTDVGPFRDVFLPGRFYAWKGDGGVLMCTWPNGGIREDYKKHWQYGYFNEVMSGFEHQLAAHMISQGDESFMTKGLAIMRTVHDRYAPAKRNPYNEVEFSDFYARAMASYGSFLEICGFHYHGPKKEISFSPLLSQAKFKSAFTASEGWGAYSQVIESGKMDARVELQWGKLSLAKVNLDVQDLTPVTAEVSYGGKIIPSEISLDGSAIQINFSDAVDITAGQTLKISIK